MIALQIIRVFVGSVSGYIALLLSNALVRHVFSSEAGDEASLVELNVTRFLTLCCAVLGGWLGVMIGGHKSGLAVPALMTILCFLELAFWFTHGLPEGPLWFDIVWGFLLAIGFFAGTLIYLKWPLFRESAANSTIPPAANDS